MRHLIPVYRLSMKTSKTKVCNTVPWTHQQIVASKLRARGIVRHQSFCSKVHQGLQLDHYQARSDKVLQVVLWKGLFRFDCSMKNKSHTANKVECVTLEPNLRHFFLCFLSIILYPLSTINMNLVFNLILTPFHVFHSLMKHKIAYINFGHSLEIVLSFSTFLGLHQNRTKGIKKIYRYFCHVQTKWSDFWGFDSSVENLLRSYSAVGFGNFVSVW